MDHRIEPLRPATSAEIEQLTRIYEQLMPESVQFVSLLENIVRIRSALSCTAYQRASARFQKTIFIPDRPNPTQFATFLAISQDEDIQVVVNTLQQPPTELEDAIRYSKYIKWQHTPVFVSSGNSEIRASLHKVAFERGIVAELTSDCINYWLPRDKAANITYDVPDDVVLQALEVKHAKLLDDWWPFRYKTSLRFFESVIEHNAGLGLFDKNNNELVACVMKNDHDGVGHLFTIPERNSRGYGTTLAKAMTKLIATEHKQHVHTFIGRTNSRSMKLFEKLGFVPVNETQWHKM